MKNIYALMVAIDAYPLPHHRLNGCVNDMRAMQNFIKQRFQQGDSALHLIVLENEQATRENIVDGFKNHLTKAKEGDVAFYYFSGHGSQEPAHESFWYLEPTKKIQTTVCYDSRLENGRDLADKELSVLISDVAQNGPEVLAIMDCCHSGSGTRQMGEAAKTRQMEDRSGVRQPETFLGYERYKYENGKLTQVPAGKHILMAAAASHETAKETRIQGTPRGVFTYSLLETLANARSPLTYRDLRDRTQTKVYNLAEAQTPQLDLFDTDDANKLFLGGAVAGKEDYTMVTWLKEKGWVTPLGGLHGLQTPASTDKRPTKFALFDQDATESELKDSSKRIGWAVLKEVEPAQSILTLQGVDANDTGKQYKAVLAQMANTPMRLWLEGDAQSLDPLKKALAGEGKSPAFIALAETPQEANYRVMAKNGEYKITRMDDERPLVMKAKGYNAAKVCNDLEHIARWTKGVELFNSQSNFEQFPIEVTITKVTKHNGPSVQEEVSLGDAQTVPMPYKYVHGAWESSKFRVKLKNTTEEPLHVAMVMYSGRYAIDHVPVNVFITEDLHGKKTTRFDWTYELRPKEEIWMVGGRFLEAKLNQEFEDNAITESTDILKLFASTAAIDMSKFEKQKALELPVPNARVAVDFLADDDLLGFLKGDWATKNFYIHTVKPLSLKPFGWNKGAEWFGVSVAEHASVSGSMALSTETQANLGLGRSVLLPAQPEGLSLTAIQFTEGWKTDTGLCVLELFDVKGAPTPAQPLQVRLDSHLANSTNTIIAVGANASGFVKVGEGQGGSIQLTALPEATATASEGLPASHKIAFYKIVGDASKLRL